jgi:hypothetical protein
MPRFEENGLEFFVYNGGGGLAGVRPKADPTGHVFVRDPDMAQNLNMKAAKSLCTKGRFAVGSDSSGAFWFSCGGQEVRNADRFQVASPADWKRYSSYFR